MSSGLFDDHSENEPAPVGDDVNSVSVGKPVKVETKTVQQRNKEKVHKKKEALAKAAKEKRIRDNQLFRCVRRLHSFVDVLLVCLLESNPFVKRWPRKLLSINNAR